MKGKKTALIILDGWGHGDKTKSDAIYNAKTPYIDSLYAKYPNCELLTDGENVGLPKNQMGNSEVGHLHIGAGRIVQSMLPRIDEAIASGGLSNNKELLQMLSDTKLNGGEVHIAGLISNGGVHGHARHLKSLTKIKIGLVCKLYISNYRKNDYSFVVACSKIAH